MGQMLYFTESGHLGVLSAGLCLALVLAQSPAMNRWRGRGERLPRRMARSGIGESPQASIAECTSATHWSMVSWSLETTHAHSAHGVS